MHVLARREIVTVNVHPWCSVYGYDFHVALRHGGNGRRNRIGVRVIGG